MMPADCSVYEWCYDQKQGAWVQWMDTIPEFKCDPEKPFSEVRGEVAAMAWLPHQYCQHAVDAQHVGVPTAIFCLFELGFLQLAAAQSVPDVLHQWASLDPHLQHIRALVHILNLHDAT
jgi:hypothetical protein